MSLLNVNRALFRGLCPSGNTNQHENPNCLFFCNFSCPILCACVILDTEM